MMTKQNKILIITGAVLLAFITVLENGIFRKSGQVYWDPELKLTAAQFKGYVNIFSNYGGAIASNFEYDIEGSTYDSIRINTIMYPERSWLHRSIRNSEEALRHEHYHFHISEIFARKFRMLLAGMEGQEIYMRNLRRQYRGLTLALSEMQDQYDDDCDHGLLRERQMDWEYMVDSMMVALNHFEDDQPVTNTGNAFPGNCFRDLELDAYYRLQGLYSIPDSIAQYAPHYKFHYSNGQLSRIEHLEKGKRVPEAFSNVAIVEIAYPENTEIRTYLDAQGKPVQNNEGVYGMKLERHDKTMLVTYLDNHGNPILCKDGFASMMYKLDYKGRLMTGRFFDLEGRNVITKSGLQIVTRKYDHNDNLIEYANYSPHNQLKNNVFGIALALYAYDAFGNMVTATNYNRDHQLTEFANGVAIYHAVYDRNGFVLLEFAMDQEERVKTGNEGRAYYYRSFDAFGNLTDIRAYGTNKNLVIDENGKGRMRNSYDKQSRLITSENYDAYDQLSNDAEGVCKTDFRYDDKDRIIEKDLFAVDSTGLTHYSKTVRLTYTEQDETASETYLDQDGALLPDSSGICTIEYRYDAEGNAVETNHYNQSGQLQPVFSEVTTIRKKFSNGMAVETAYFDADGQPTTGNASAEITRWCYNQEGLVVEEQYLSADGQPKADATGIALKQYTRDRFGKVLSVHYFNQQLEPAEDENGGVARAEYTYDKDDNVIRVSYMDAGGRLVDNQDGYAIENNYYDHHGRLKIKEFLTRFKQPVVMSEGYARTEYMYDWNGNIIARILRDASGDLIADASGNAIYNYVYDRNGEVIQTIEFDADPANLEAVSKGDFCTSANIPNSFYTPLMRFSSRDGTRSTYYDNGQKQSEGFYLDGKLQGAYYTWYEDGTLSSEVQYVNGKREGLTIEYYQNGVKWREVRYDNNKARMYTMVTWHMNGALRSKYVNGQEVFWDENGKRVD